jgi:peptide/nickel transport system substrate-binding protein
MKHKWSIFSLLVTATLIISACGGGGTAAPTSAPAASAPAATEAPRDTAVPPTEAPVEPRVLKVAATANITTWDPVKSFSTEALYMANVYEQLLRINPPGSSEQFTPLLAESWESSADGLTWTFKLRPGVTFHDGEPLTAEAVKMSIEAAADHGGASFIWLPLDTIEAVDELTVQFNLKYAAPVDLIASSLYGAWIVSPKALEAAAADENYFEAGIEAGTGPYMLESYTPDKEILLTRFDGYWGGWDDVKHYDKVLVTITPEAVQQQQMLEGGEVDLALSIPLENIGDFKDKPGYNFYEEPSFFNYVGYFNTLRAPLDNQLVRQALSYAIPYDDIIAIGAQGYATQSRGPVPAGVFPWSENTPQYTYDLKKAKELLTQAGHPGGGFSLRLTYAAENQSEERFAPLIKDAFAEIGVEVEIEAIKFSQQWEQAKSDPANAQDIFLVLYWPTYSDAGSDNLWSLFHSSEKPFFNLSYWKNEQYDALVDEAGVLTGTDRATAQAKYEEAMNLLVDEAPGIFFYDTKAVYAFPDYIKGFEYNLNYPFALFFYPLYTD